MRSATLRREQNRSGRRSGQGLASAGRHQPEPPNGPRPIGIRRARPIPAPVSAVSNDSLRPTQQVSWQSERLMALRAANRAARAGHDVLHVGEARVASALPDELMDRLLAATPNLSPTDAWDLLTLMGYYLSSLDFQALISNRRPPRKAAISVVVPKMERLLLKLADIIGCWPRDIAPITWGDPCAPRWLGSVSEVQFAELIRELEMRLPVVAQALSDLRRGRCTLSDAAPRILTEARFIEDLASRSALVIAGCPVKDDFRPFLQPIYIDGKLYDGPKPFYTDGWSHLTQSVQEWPRRSFADAARNLTHTILLSTQGRERRQLLQNDADMKLTAAVDALTLSANILNHALSHSLKGGSDGRSH